MNTAAGISTPWTQARLWSLAGRTPFVVVLAGIDRSEIIDAGLADTALTDAAFVRFEPACSPPCDALLWRLETASGYSLNQRGIVRAHWHRQPYAMTVRLVQYQPGSSAPEVLDEGTIGTRGRYASFAASVDRLAMRFVRDAALGRGRGPSRSTPAIAPHGMPGRWDALREGWRDRFLTEWWTIGSSVADAEQVFSGGGLGSIAWHRPEAGHRYLADPFPWFGTGQILCEEMPLTDGVGRIVSVNASDAPAVILDDGFHHSYPCTFPDGDTIYCVPESTERGATRIYRLTTDGGLSPVCDVAEHARLADPTLFTWMGRYWLACTDLDLGAHDNLCLFHAASITGPWVPHKRWPVKIDVRGARPAGMVFELDGKLFRPAQNCARTYGGSLTIHEIVTLTETEFQENQVAELSPDRLGPLPHGLHTLVHDGERFWVDGKRFIFDPVLIRKKLMARISRIFS